MLIHRPWLLKYHVPSKLRVLPWAEGGVDRSDVCWQWAHLFLSVSEGNFTIFSWFAGAQQSWSVTWTEHPETCRRVQPRRWQLDSGDGTRTAQEDVAGPRFWRSGAESAAVFNPRKKSPSSVRIPTIRAGLAQSRSQPPGTPAVPRTRINVARVRLCVGSDSDSVTPAGMISWRLLSSAPATFLHSPASELTWLTSHCHSVSSRSPQPLRRGTDTRLETLTVSGDAG